MNERFRDDSRVNLLHQELTAHSEANFNQKTYLEGREHSHVDAALEPAVVLAEEDHTSTRATQGLVGGGGDNVTVLGEGDEDEGVIGEKDGQ